LKTDNYRKQYDYHVLPTMRLSEIVVDYKELRNIWNSFTDGMIAYDNDNGMNRHSSYLTKRMESETRCDEYLNKIKSTVAIMVQQFQMKQAADADARTEISKTGILDTCSMINYRWSEDIFLKNETIQDGKSHGIVMYLDWSGSMSSIIGDTVEQLLILTQFCKKLNIPFDVYSFSSRRYFDDMNDEGSYINAQYMETENDEVMKPHNFTLFQLLSSDMKKQEYKDAVNDLYYLADKEGSYYGMGPRALDMGCTPLNEAVVSAMQMIPTFQEKHDVQIVNAVFLSDGDGHSMGAYPAYGNSDSKTIIHDPKTRKDYDVNGGQYSRSDSETSQYLTILKDRIGCNVIGIKLESGKRIDHIRYRYLNDDTKQLEIAMKNWRKHNFIAVDANGYDKLFIVQGNLKTETDLLDGLADDVSYVKLKNAFMKGANNSKTSRVIATQMVDIIAQ